MNNRLYDTFFVLLVFVMLALAACSSATGTETTVPTAIPETAIPTESPTPETFSDPFAYCTAVGQIDTPDARYTGQQMSDDLFEVYLIAAGLDPNDDYPDTFRQMTIWRCMDHEV